MIKIVYLYFVYKYDTNCFFLVTANKTKDDRNEDKTTELQNELDQVIQVLHKIIQELLADRDSTLEKLKVIYVQYFDNIAIKRLYNKLRRMICDF